MADLILPKFAYAVRRIAVNSHGNFVPGKFGKYHLRRPGSNSPMILTAVCGTMLDLTDHDNVDEALVRELRAENLCRKCLGPLEVK